MKMIRSIRRPRGAAEVLAFFVVLLGLPSMAEATTYYVAKAAQGGSDSNSCPQASQTSGGVPTLPMLSIASGVACMSAGDTLVIRAGVYDEAIPTASLTGGVSEATRYTFRAYEREEVTLTEVNATQMYSSANSYYTFDGLKWDLSAKPSLPPDTQAYDYFTIAGPSLSDRSHHITFRDCEITGMFGNGLLVKSDHLIVQNCHIHHLRGAANPPGATYGQQYYGIYLGGGTNVLVENNEIDHAPGGGMQIYPGPFNGVTVRNNRIHDNNTISAAGWGVVVAREPQYTMAGVQIYNNLFYNNGSASVSPGAAGLIVGFGSTGVKVWNNTAYGNKGYGISFDNSGGPSAQDTEFRNNIMWGNLSEGFDDVGINTIKSNNLCSGGQCAPFSSDPLFESPATADFHLQANSPARDQGFDLSGVFTTDYEGQPRVNGFDIGADELSSVDTTPPARLTGLSIE